MAKTNYQTINDYHEVFPAEIAARMQTIREMVHKIAPNVQEIISYQIPAFQLHNKYKLIYYCAFTKHLTLSSPWSKAFLKEFEEPLKAYKVSKAAIQIPHNRTLPIELIEKILKFRKAELEAMAN